MIRTILLVIALAIIFIIGFLFWPVIWIARIFSQNVADHIALFYVQVGCRIACFLSGVRLEKKGLENISKDKPVVYVMNHRSIFDIIVTYPYFKTLTGFVAKKELSGIPVFSYWLKLANGLFLDRQNIREGLKTILAAIEKIKSGISMCIFPEGTRNKDQESKTSLLEFHDASFKLAEKTGAAIVPIVLYNTADCFENHKPKIRSTKVKMTVGTPILLENLEKEEKKFLGKYVQGIMQNMLNEMEE